MPFVTLGEYYFSNKTILNLFLKKYTFILNTKIYLLLNHNQQILESSQGGIHGSQASKFDEKSISNLHLQGRICLEEYWNSCHTMADLQNHQYSQNLIHVNAERISRVHICKEKKTNCKEKMMFKKSDRWGKNNPCSYLQRNIYVKKIYIGT